jgi:hypothetical protein
LKACPMSTTATMSILWMRVPQWQGDPQGLVLENRRLRFRCWVCQTWRHVRLQPVMRFKADIEPPAEVAGAAGPQRWTQSHAAGLDRTCWAGMLSSCSSGRVN